MSLRRIDFCRQVARYELYDGSVQQMNAHYIITIETRLFEAEGGDASQLVSMMEYDGCEGVESSSDTR